MAPLCRHFCDQYICVVPVSRRLLPTPAHHMDLATARYRIISSMSGVISDICLPKESIEAKVTARHPLP